MKTSQKITLDSEDSMVIIKNIILDGLKAYSTQKHSDQYYIKATTSDNTSIIIKMFCPEVLDFGFYVYIYLDKPGNSRIPLMSFPSAGSDDDNVWLEKMSKTVANCIVSCYEEDNKYIQITYNTDEKNPKRRYTEIAIAEELINPEYEVDDKFWQWVEFINDNLEIGQRTIMSGAWNINIGSPEQCKSNFSILVEKTKICNKNVYYVDVNKPGKHENEILHSVVDLSDYLYEQCDYINKLKSYTLPEKGESINLKFYKQEDM